MSVRTALQARARLAVQVPRGARKRLRDLSEPSGAEPARNEPPEPKTAQGREPDAPPEPPEQQPEPPTTHRTRTLRVELGVQEDGTPLCWNSAAEMNSFVAAVGASGSGKTELLKLFSQEARKAAIPVILVDVHGDLTAPRLPDYRIGIGGGYSLNPLDGPAAMPERTAWITGPITEAAELGRVQTHALTKAVAETLQHANATHTRPTVVALKKRVADSQFGSRASVDGLVAALDQLFEPSAFSGRELPIGSLLSLGGHLNLTALSTRAQLLVVQALLAQVWSALLSQGEVPVGRIRALLVLDEAARLKGSQLLERVVRECRKFGLAMCIASQLADDLSDAVGGIAGTAIVLRLLGQRAQQQAAELLGPPITRLQVAQLARPGDAWVRSEQGIHRVQLHRPGGK